MLTSTKNFATWWKNRKIDWNTHYLQTWNHPHRAIISWMLKPIPFVSLWEVGCGPGANIVRLTKDFPGRQFGGSDVSEDAIKLARETFKGGLFHVESGDNLMMSDKSVDVVLSDMMLIYVDPFHIDNYLKEMKRIGRMHIILVEFHSSSWWKRQITRFHRYHVYDYRKRLEKLGFYDIMIQHIPEQYWPDADKNAEFRTIITAKV